MGEFANQSDNIVEELLKIVPISYFTTEDFQQRCKEGGYWNRWNICHTQVYFKGTNMLISSKERANLVLEKVCCELNNNSNRALYKFVSLVIKGYCDYENTKIDLSNLRILLETIGVKNISELERYDSNIPSAHNIFKANKTYNDNVYKAIINRIYKLCKEYEQHESIYKGRHEEELRDLIVSTLNSADFGVNSSAETFNYKGKTDIITKASDNSNIFIAECKIWNGEKKLSEAIDQLFNYVTWRDTGTSLILFVKKGRIRDIIEKAKSTAVKHSCYIRYNGQTEESSFSFTYHTKDDPRSPIALELMIFHYPE